MVEEEEGEEEMVEEVEEEEVEEKQGRKASRGRRRWRSGQASGDPPFPTHLYTQLLSPGFLQIYSQSCPKPNSQISVKGSSTFLISFLNCHF